MIDCVFCKIANRESPAEIILETEKVISFLDINPINYGHILVIPKDHFEQFHQIPEEASKELIIVLSKLSKAVLNAFNPHGYNIFTNNGRFAGQAIMHCHFHIVPRYFNDGFKFRPKPKFYKENEIQLYGKIIRENLED